MSAILSAFKTAPKQKDWPASMVHILKDDPPLRRADNRHLIDYELELKKAKMMSAKQLSDVLNIPLFFVESKLRDLVKIGRAKKITLNRLAFFMSVDREVN
jgi:hypothetical protein